MKNKLATLPENIRYVIREVSAAARQSNVRVYLVGGIVRDILLDAHSAESGIFNRENFDLDFVVEGDGIAFAERVAARLQGTLVCHRRFGTATVDSKDGKIDFATARREVYQRSGSLPEVAFASLQEDLVRRDFTINAMAVSVNEADYGMLVDPYHGQRDLQKKYIRVLHDRSFLDDPTRIFRAVRFKERFHFRFEPRTARLMAEAVDSGALSYINAHRVRDELILLLSESSPQRDIQTVQKICGLDFIAKGYRFVAGDRKLFRCIGRSIHWYTGLSAQCRQHHIQSWLVYLCGLIYRQSSAKRSDFCRIFGLSLAQQRVLDPLSRVECMVRVLRKKMLISKRYRLLHGLSPEFLVFVRAYAQSLRGSHAGVQEHIEDYLIHRKGAKLNISGHDLKMLKIEPALLYNTLFTRLLNRKLDGYIHTIDDEKKEAVKIFNKLRNKMSS